MKTMNISNFQTKQGSGNHLNQTILDREVNSFQIVIPGETDVKNSKLSPENMFDVIYDS